MLYGYYGECNAGDDAFTTVCIQELALRGHGPIGVLANHLPTIAGLPAKHLLTKHHFGGLAGHLEQARIRWWLARGARIVVGGGSLFRHSAGLLELERLLSRSPRTGHRAMGVSIGPFSDDRAADICARVLQRFDSVGVRDLPSLERAKKIAPDARVELSFDLAPLLPAFAPESSARTDRQTQELGVALCGPAVTETEYHAIRQALEVWLAGGQDRKIVLLPFNEHPRKGDLPVHQRLADELGHAGAVELYRYRGDPRAIWTRIARLDGIVAMRLHAAVFGYCSERPVLIVPYEEKCTAWAQMIGQGSEFVVTAQELTDDHLAALSSRGRPTASLPVVDAKLRARTNFSWAEH